jgi:multisubunit Na+/H+ antiporter MnhE subunit
MKFSNAIWISLAVPGTDIEIIALIVKNDISFNSPQIY